MKLSGNQATQLVFQFLPAVFFIGFWHASCPSSFAQTAPAKRNIVILSRVVEADYASAEYSDRRFDALLQGSANRVVQVNSKDTLSKIVSAAFSIGPTRAPEIYGALERRILDLNGISEVRDLRPGPLKIPDIPRAALGNPSSTNPYNTIPKTSFLGSTSTPTRDFWSTKLAAYTGVPSVSDVFRAGARRVNQVRVLPENEAIPLAAKVGDPPPKPGEYMADTSAIRIKLGATSVPESTVRILSDDTRGRLEKILSAPARLSPVLVVLDDGWPDQESFIKARDFVADASERIRVHFKLGASGNLKSLRGMKRTDFPPMVPPYPEMKMHSAVIKSALKEFVDLDLQERVKVIYLPLVPAQIGASAVLREIISTAATAKYVREGLGSVDATDDVRQIGNNVAAVAIQNSGTLLQPLESGGTLESDQAIVESVANFMKMYSQITGDPHYISLSWIVPDMKFQIYIMNPSYGLLVAAAGNEKGENVNRENRQFAARSLNPGDTLAVMNVDGSGAPTCSSSVLEVDPTVSVLGAGFPGHVTDGLCGTSFSTPRVAWLLAAREAVAGNKVPEGELYLWAGRNKRWLESLQNSTQTGPRKFQISPEKLLGF